MKYLKLFEDHKETSDKITQIQTDADNKIQETIEEYKSLIDQFMYEITDDYEAYSTTHTLDVEVSLDRLTKTYVHYTILFEAGHYEDLLKKLSEVVERLQEAHNVTHIINGIYSELGNKIPSGRVSRLRYPFDISECRNIIITHIKNVHNNYAGDVKLKLKISF
jgi:predicted small metal-binding protein